MIKRMMIMLALCALVLGGVFGWKTFGFAMMKKGMAAGANPPQTVSTIRAEMQDWQPALKAVGSLRAVKGADLASEVAGIVEDIHFESGDDVEEGKVLVHLRDEDDVAKLQALEAQARLADITLNRDQKQLKAQAVAQATVDADAANLNSANALVEAQRALLAKKTIRAPFAGRIGVRSVDVGQYLNPGTAVVTLQQLDPIYVDFYLPEQSLAQIQTGQKVFAVIDAHTEKTFEGEVTALNAKVDSNTRNILVRATFKNAERLLLPGMFANVTLATGAPQRFITLPQTSITYNPYGNTIYAVETKEAEGGKSSLTARQVFVTTGDTRGDQIAILTGVKEGDEVVTSGQLKLHNGSPLAINNNVQPTNDINPKPEDK
jgi:membrane fusion protein, multidrug efflux system